MIFSSPYPEGGRGHVKMPPSTPVAGCGAVMLLTSYCKVLAALEANAPVAMAYDSGAICANVSAGKQPARTFPTCGMHHWQGRPVGFTILESLRCFGVAAEHHVSRLRHRWAMPACVERRPALYSSPYPEGGRATLRCLPPHRWPGVGQLCFWQVLVVLEANAPVAKAYDSGAICANVSAGGQPARTLSTCGMHSPHVPTPRADCILGRGGHSLSSR